MVGLHGDFSQQRAVLSFLGTPVCLGIPGGSAPSCISQAWRGDMWALPWVPALGMRQVSLEPCAEQDGGCVQSQWIEPYRCPNLYRRGPWAMLGNLPSDRPEFLRLLQVSQGSQAACHWFGGSIGGTECNRLIHPRELVMDREAWHSIHGVTKIWTQLSD